MKLEDLKKESPKIPENIHKMIENEVKVQLEKAENHTSKNNIVKMRKPYKKAVAIVLVATMAVGTTAYAATKYFQWKLEQNGNYGLSVSSEKSEDYPEKKEIYQLSITPNWLPEGMIQDEEMKYSFENNRKRGGFSLQTLLINQENLDEGEVLETYVASNEQIEIGEHAAVIIEKEGDNMFDKKAYVAYPEYGYVIVCYAGTDVTTDQLQQFLENLNVTETEQPVDPEAIGYFGESDEIKVEPEREGSKLIATEEDMKNMHKIGDVIDTEIVQYDGSEESVIHLQIKVSDVQLFDDSSVLDSKYVSDDLKNAFDPDGNLKNETVHYLTSGDGVTTLNQEIYTEELSQKLVYATVEYTNTGSEEIKDYCFMVQFPQLISDEKGYHYYDRALDDGIKETVQYTVGREQRYGNEMEYYDIKGGERGNNHIESIKPGETVTVHVGRIIFADEADKVFILPLDLGNSQTSFSDSALEVGYVDARMK